MKVHIEFIERRVLEQIRLALAPLADADPELADKTALALTLAKIRPLREKADTWGFLPADCLFEMARVHGAVAQGITNALRETDEAAQRARERERAGELPS